MPMTEQQKRENERAVARCLATLRARLADARAKGRVELHLALDDVDVLLTLAEAVAQAKGWKQ